MCRTTTERPRRPATAGSATPRLQHLYYAFLSYSHKDQAMADWLHRELERFRVPRSLAGQLTDERRHSQAPVSDLPRPARACCGRRSRRGDPRGACLLALPDRALLARRRQVALGQCRDRNLQADPAGRMRARRDRRRQPVRQRRPRTRGRGMLPAGAAEKYDRRGRPTGKRAEPLAADLREGADGRRTGFLKLVAGMLGVGLDDLVQRDDDASSPAARLSRRSIACRNGGHQRPRRHRDPGPRRGPRPAPRSRGPRRVHARRLKDKLEPIGRLDALDGVGSRVLEYYSKQDASELSDAALLQRARALSLTQSRLSARRSELRPAVVWGGGARDWRSGQTQPRRPTAAVRSRPKRLLGRARSLATAGKSKSAEAAFREYKALADRMVALEPDNLKWRMEVQYARENLGIVLMSQRRFAAAVRRI